MSNSSNGVANNAASRIVATAYRWEGENLVDYNLVNVGGSYKIDPTPPEGPKEVKDVCRMIFRPSDGSPPLVVDIVPTYTEKILPGHSGIKIRDSYRRADINFAVRSVWFRPIIDLTSLALREVFVFEMKLEAGAANDYSSFESKDLKDEKLIANFTPTLSAVLASTAPHELAESRTDLAINNDDALGMKFDPKGHGVLRFEERKKEVQGASQPLRFFTMRFDAPLERREKDDAQVLRGFNQSFIANRFNRGIKADKDFPDADEIIVFEEKEERPLKWMGHQLAADELAPVRPSNKRAAWVITIEGLPTRKAVKVWNRVANDFHLGVRTVKAGNKVSFIPTFEEVDSTDCSTNPPSKDEQGWAVGYFLRDAINAGVPKYFVEGRDQCKPGEQLKCAKLTAFSVWPIGPCKSLRAVFPGAFDEARENLSSNITVSETREEDYLKFQKSPGLKLNCGKISFSDERSVRLGAIDLLFGPEKQTIKEAEDGFLQLSFERNLPEGQPFFEDERFQIPIDAATAKKTPPEARRLNDHLKIYFDVAQVLPGGEDAPASDEFIKDPELSLDERGPEFNRDSPIILPWGRQSQKSGLLYLEVNEQNDATHTDSVAIKLRNLKQSESKEVQRLIIIDPDPFSIVAVKFPPFDSQGTKNQSNLIGFWINGPSGARWQLQSLSEDFSMVLPPQVLGEEMEKHRTIQAGSAINFRFSQPTTIGLSQSEFPQNFREPPWNLRRLLEPENAQASGAKVVFMQYELLYGLSCSFNTRETNIKNLRLIEIFKRFGRIPGALGSRDKNCKDALDEKCNENPAETWARLFRRYRARVGVFMPWEPSNEQSLILNEGIQCIIRRRVDPQNPSDLGDGANWADPFDETKDIFKPNAPTPHDYKALRGGATWGFESRNVFTAITRPNPNTGKIESNTARLIDPAFSSLGGWGSVKATFDNNRSAIYGDAAMGRTFSYTLERIGRIACFWNRAKHVIVYERHVAASPQFVCEQDGQRLGTAPDNELTGLPLLRKTHEYVEILEETRTYPENPLSPPMQRGCVTGCYFTKGQRINVDSMWGSDVGDHGWKVPLWNPTARLDVYPKPVFSIGLESDVAGRSADCPCQCDNPENVFFYTSTDPNLTADTDAWPAVLDVDYVNLPLPQPRENEYPEGTLIPVFPGDPPVAPGFTPCTFRVVKPASPVNLVAQRADKPLSTLLQNVTMMRASVRQAADAVKSSFTTLHNLNREVANIYAEVFKRLPEADTEPVDKIRDRLQGIISAQEEKIKALNKSIQDDVQSTLNDIEKKFKAQVLERENQILDTIGSRLIGPLSEKGVRVSGFIHDIREEYKSILDNLLPQPGQAPPPNLKDTVKEAIDRMFQKAIVTIFMVPFSSNILRRPLEHFRDVVTDAKNRYVSRWLELKKTVSDITAIGEAERLKLQELVGRAEAEVQALISNMENFRARLPEAWMPDPKGVRELITKAVISLKGYETTLGELRKAIDEKNKDKILLQIDALLDLAERADTFKPLLDKFKDLSLLDAAGKEIGDPIRKEIKGKLVAWLERQRDALKAQVDETDVGQLRDTIADFDRLLSDTEINTRVQEFKDIINRDDVQKLIDKYSQEYTKFKKDIDDVLSRLNVDNLRDRINTAIQQAGTLPVFTALDKERQEFLELINRAYEDNYKRLQEGAAQVFQSADSAVRLVRAFGPPPIVPNLAFDRPEVAFFYKEAQRFVDITPVLGRVNQAQQAADALKALGVRLPTKQLLNDLVPQPLENFDLRKIFPDFSGLKLDNLFPGLKMPPIANDRVRISHGVDAQTRRAWVQAVVDNVQISKPATLFAIGPVELSVPKSNFTALTRFEAAQGETPKRQINAKITGDWEVKIGGQSMILFRDTELSFDDAQGLKFRIQPSRIQLNGILTFVSDLLNKLGGKDSGLSFGMLPDGGIQCVLSLPLPDVQFGAFGISHLNLGALLALRLNDPLMEGFSIELGFNLGRKLAPFALTVFLLGGGGYLEVSTRYAPGNGRLRCFVSLGITVSASLAISLGPISGGVYIYFGITAEFQAGGGARFAIGVMLLMRGEVSLLGIVSASISLLLEAQYDTTSGQIIGRGRLTISIEICWCFTLEINEEVTYTVGEGSQSSSRLGLQGSAMLASNLAEGDDELNRSIIAAALSPATPSADELVTDYINMLA